MNIRKCLEKFWANTPKNNAAEILKDHGVPNFDIFLENSEKNPKYLGDLEKF